MEIEDEYYDAMATNGVSSMSVPTTIQQVGCHDAEDIYSCYNPFVILLLITVQRRNLNDR